MYLDYSGNVQTLITVGDALLSHAGFIEVFKEPDGRLCLRLPLQGIYSGRDEEEVAVEVGQFDPDQHPTPSELTASARVEGWGISGDAAGEQRELFAEFQGEVARRK